MQVISYFDNDLPSLRVNGTFNDNTKAMVINFQKKYGLPTTGEVDADTWDKIIQVYVNTINNIPKEYAIYEDELFPGRILALGMTGDDVKTIQKFLLKICQKFKNIPGVRVSGIFDDIMEKSVMKIQSLYNLDTTGVIEPVTWYNIVEYSKK